MSNENTQGAGPEAGQKSSFLEAAERGAAQGKGSLDGSDGYEPITEGASERGIFRLVGGYFDEKTGKVHDEVELRAMTGHEEDLLSNDKVPFFQRMTGILTHCCVRIGDLTSREDVTRAIRGLPAGSRQHLLVCLRRTSHWRSTKDIYDMKMECPSCKKDYDYKVDLSTLDLYEMPDATKRVFEGTLPESGLNYSWRITASDQDQILTSLAQDDSTESELLTWATITRLLQLGDFKGDVRPFEIIDTETFKLLDSRKMAKRVHELRLAVKNLSSGDRQFLRDQFMENEPGVETDIDCTCPKSKGGCGKEFVARLDLGQRSFFFPSARRSRSNRRSFI